MKPAGQDELPDLPDELMLQRLMQQTINAERGDRGTGSLGKWLYLIRHNWP